MTSLYENFNVEVLPINETHNADVESLSRCLDALLSKEAELKQTVNTLVIFCDDLTYPDEFEEIAYKCEEQLFELLKVLQHGTKLYLSNIRLKYSLLVELVGDSYINIKLNDAFVYWVWAKTLSKKSPQKH